MIKLNIRRDMDRSDYPVAKWWVTYTYQMPGDRSVRIEEIESGSCRWERREPWRDVVRRILDADYPKE